MSNKETKKCLLIFTQWFFPARKAGGPIRSIQNLVDLIGEEVNIYIYTSDRDMGDDMSFASVTNDLWLQMNDKYEIIYKSPADFGIHAIRDAIHYARPDAVYLNSMYSFKFTILPLIELFRMRYKGRIILAPRGMLRSSAIKFKRIKKLIFLFLFRSSKISDKMMYHATDADEKNDILFRLGASEKNIVMIHNPPVKQLPYIPIEKQSGSVKLIFIGRIHPIKGLDYVLDRLQSIKADVELNIAGWIEDKSYYNLCNDKIKSLPSNIHVNILGNLQFEDLMNEINRNHFMILPTHGENFGHSIMEALSAGRPVIISNETPWKKLEQRGIGWDIPLSQPLKFVEAINSASAMDQKAYENMSQKAVEVSKAFLSQDDLKEKYLQLFNLTVSTLSKGVHV